MAGTSIKAELNPTLRTFCANSECQKQISVETNHYDPDKKDVWTWGLVGIVGNKKKVFPVCNQCYEAGWRPPNFEWMN